MNMSMEVLGMNLFMFFMVSIMGCSIIEKLDRMTDPNYISKPRHNKRHV